MLPDYPRLKTKFRKRLLKAMQQKINQRAPLTARISHYWQPEGSDFSYEDYSGDVRISRTEEVKAAFTIPRDLPPLKTIQQVFEALEAAAADMARQSETILFRKLDEATQESGNVVGAPGQPFGPAALLEALDKLSIDFDESGKPKMPMIVLHPDVFNSIKDRIPQWESDPEFIKERREIMERKKEEWRDRESHRKLVG